MNAGADRDQLGEVIRVDCYNEDEQMTAFHTVLTEEVALPTEAGTVGMSVQVLDFDIREGGSELTARCRRGAAEQELCLVDLVFPPQTVAAWIHAAYRRCLGLRPHPAEIPRGWKPSWL